MSQELLKKALSFTNNDLEMNRLLRISDFQLQGLRDSANYFSQLGTGGLILSVVLFFVTAIWVSKSDWKKPSIQTLESAPKLLVGFGVLVAVIFGVSLFLTLWSLLQNSSYNRQLTVLTADGKVTRFGADEYYHLIKIGELEFYVDEKTHDAFTDGFYRVYYLDRSTILSAEPLPQ